MKKMILTLVAAAAMVFTTQNVSAQVTAEATPTVQETQQKTDFVKIEVADLPTEVQGAVERDFQGATVSEAFVKEKEGEKKYKIVLSTTDGQTKELYSDAQGNWIDKDKKKEQEQTEE